MTKIMLVEDDNNLREIYEARLAAEGYDIVAAPDGEAALALAAKERPDLIITDVMMPKISGFEMLDIMRNTENLRDVKVIMLTALGQAEDNARAGALGADRYLVKSQVTLEDIVKATHDVINTGAPVAAAATDPTADAAAEPETPPAAEAIVATDPVADVAQPVVAAEPTENSDDAEVQPTVATASEPDLDLATAPINAPSEAAAPAWQPPEPEIVAVEPPAAPSITIPVMDDAAEPVDVPAPQADVPVLDAPVQQDDTSQDNAMPVQEDASLPADDDNSATSQDAQQVQQDEPQADTADQTQDQSEEVQPDLQALADVTTSTSAQEEDVMREQIDQFLGAVDVSDQTAVVTSDEPQSPSEENEAELATDAATPDLGQLSVQAEPTAVPDNPEVAPEVEAAPVQAPAPESAPEPVAEPAAAQQAPTQYPSRPFGLPITPEYVSDPSTQTPGDQVVADAITNMMASSPAAESYPVQPAPAAILPEPVTAPAPEAAPEVQAAPVQPPAEELVEAPAELPDQEPGSEQPAEPAAPGEPDPNAPAPIAHKRVISPLEQPSRPDINQLLAMEEAKAAATQIVAAPQQPPSIPLQPAPGEPAPRQPWRMPGQQTQGPTHNYGQSGIDPNSISL